MEQRVIKFRVWDASPIKDGFDGIMINMDYTIKSSYFIGAMEGKYPIMQFTGLESKKKQPLYEGDICTKMISPDENNLAPRELYRGVIVFHYGGFCLKVGKYYYPLSRQHGVIEVIGNIYEHPHLLIKTER